MYCLQTDNKVQISYTFGDGRHEIRIVEGQNPIDVTVDSVGKKQFNSSGTVAINYTAPGNITSVTCTGKFRQIGNRPDTELSCDYIIGLGVISGHQFTSEYDSFYNDNTGDMTFTISYVADYCIIRVRNSQEKLIFKDEGQCPCTYDVKCIPAHCPEAYCECQNDGYPGYCCNDCSDTLHKIHAMTNQVRGINGK